MPVHPSVWLDPLFPGHQTDYGIRRAVFICDACQVKWSDQVNCWCCGGRPRHVAGLVVPHW